MSTENIKADIIEARSVTVKYNTNIGEGGGITINNLNVEEEIKQNKLRNQTLENVIDSHINDTESKKHISPEEIETINDTKTKVEKLKGQIEELDTKVYNISKSIDKPEIQAHKVSIVANDEEEPGILTVNGTNVADKIESVESDISILQNKVDAHTHDINRVVKDEKRIHLTQGDIAKINSVESKAKQKDVEDHEKRINKLELSVDEKVGQSDLDNLEAKCVTYEPRAGYNAITKENLTFTKDLSFNNAQIIMYNNNIVLHNHCANIEGPESYINIKDAKVSNIVEVKGTGVEENLGDVTLDRNGEWYSVWDHLTNKVKHITKEERDRWNAKTDRTIFVLADAGEDGKPVVETPNTTYIYLVEDPRAKEGSNFHYNKWAWVERKDIPEEYAWEQIGSPALALEPSTNDDITDESVIEDYVVKHNFTLNKIEEIKNNEESQLAPTTSAVVEFVGDELEKYVNKAGDTMHGDLEMVALDGGAIPSINLNGGNLNVKKGGGITIENEPSDLTTNIYNYAVNTPVVNTGILTSINESGILYVTNTDEEPKNVSLTVSSNTDGKEDVEISSIPGEFAEITVGGDISITRTTTGENSGITIGNANTTYNLMLNGKNIGDAVSTNTTNISNLTVRVDALEENHFIVVEELPPAAEAVTNAIYLIPKKDGPEEERNIKDEYIAVDSDEGDKVWEKIGDTKIDLSDYYTKSQSDEKFVDVTGDVMTGNLYVTDGENIAAIENAGNIVSTQSVTTVTNYTRFILPIPETDEIDIVSADVNITSRNTNIASTDVNITSRNTNIIGDVHINDRIMTNWVTPNTGNTIAFYNVDSEGTTQNVNVNIIPAIGDPEKYIKMSGKPNPGENELPCEIYISNGDPEYGEVGIYDHITNPHVHLTENQIDVLNAAENGCFAYGPIKPDATRPDDPYKYENPKVLMKQIDSENNYGEVAIQVGTTNQAYIELYNDTRIPNTVDISSGYEHGNTIEVTDDGITIKTANPHADIQNAPLNVMGDTAIGNKDTNYKFTVNGVDITPDKKQVDTKNNDDYVGAGNANGAMCVIEPLSNADDVTLKSLTFTTRSGGGVTAPNGKKMALYCCNADEAPSPFKQNATAENTKHELPAGWKYIGISKNSYTNMALNTKYKYEFDDIKIEKGMMIAISFTNFEDLTETQFAWSQFGMQGRVNKTPEDHKNTFYNTSLLAATTPKSGVNYRYTINYTAEFVKDHTAKPITDTETPILYDGSIYNVTGDSITVIATDIHNQVAKSTIAFTPTADVSINNLFTGPIDKTICYEETLLQGKVSIIEITHLNVNDTNYITATITPNIK